MLNIYDESISKLNIDDWIQNKSTGGLYRIVEIGDNYVLLAESVNDGQVVDTKPKKVTFNTLKKSYLLLTEDEKNYYSQFQSIASLQKELSNMKEELWKTNSAYEVFMMKYDKLEEKYYKLKNESRYNNHNSYNRYNSYTYNYNCNSFNINTSDDMMKELLKAGYKSLSKKYHPDRGGDADKMVQLNNLKDKYGF